MGWSAWAGAATLLTLSGRGYAADEVLQLVYKRSPAAAVCPSEEVFRAEVARRLGRDPFTNEAPKKLTVSLSRRGGEFVAMGEIRDAEDGVVWEQPLHHPDCDALVSAMATGVFLELTPILPPDEPQSAAPSPKPEPSPPPATSPAPATPIAKPAAPTRSSAPTPAATARAEPSPPPLLQLGIGAFGAVARTPDPALGVLASAGLRWTRISAEFELRVLLPLLPMEARTEAGRVASLRWSIVTGTLGLCGHKGILFACVPVEVGVRDVSAEAPVRVTTLGPAFATVGLRAGIESPINRRISFRVYLDGAVMLKPQTVWFGADAAWTALPVSGLLSAAFIYTP